MNKNKISLYFIIIAAFSFLTIFLTIVQKSYFNLITPIKEVESNKLLTPINPVLNLEVISNIESRPDNSNFPGDLFFSVDTPISTSSSNQEL